MFALTATITIRLYAISPPDQSKLAARSRNLRLGPGGPNVKNSKEAVNRKAIGNKAISSKIRKFAAAMAMLIASATMAHANTVVSPASVGFGNVASGSISAAHTITITNDNSSNITISRMATSSVNFAFYYTTNLPVTLTPGKSFTATVKFKPSAVEAYTGWVEFVRSTGATSSISLSGTGTSTAVVSPAITSQPASAKIIAGQTATFNVAATGTAPMSYQWMKNGSALSGATSSSYTTPAETTTDNNAQFSVTLKNSAGSVTSNAAVLTVVNPTVAPAITTQPSSQTILSGKTATFSVAATGTAPFTYQWSKSGVAISGATSSTYTTPAETSSAQFSVKVSNSAGTATSNTATLTVTASTLILNSSTSALSFGSVNVSASSTQNVTLTNAGNSVITISNVTVSGAGFNATGASGVILNPGQTTTVSATFTPAAAGSVTGSVTVASNASNSPDSISLTGTGVAAVNHSVALSWTPGANSMTITGYNTYAATISGGPYTKVNSSPDASTTYTDSGVQAGQTYYFVVTSLDSSNVESAYSSEVSALVP
jgi:hypothetical protein